MARVNWRASNLLNPLPVVLITSMDHEGKSNVMTAAWAGTICSDPVMVSVSIRKSRYSHELISQSGEFVINMPGVDMALFTDYAGVYSGRNTDKFALDGDYKATLVPSNMIKTMTIKECPIALECKVKEIRELGSHDMFMAEVVSVSVDDGCLDENGHLDMYKARLISYCHGEYYALGRKLGKFGFSTAKKERNRRTDSLNRRKKRKA